MLREQYMKLFITLFSEFITTNIPYTTGRRNRCRMSYYVSSIALVLFYNIPWHVLDEILDDPDGLRIVILNFIYTFIFR